MSGTLERTISDLVHGDHVCLVDEEAAEQAAALAARLAGGLPT